MPKENQNLESHAGQEDMPYPLARTAKAIWRFFTSVRLTIALILVLVAFSLVGVFIIQVPADFAPGSAEYSWWLENVAWPRYGVWAGPMQFFQLFDVFHSIWFLGAGFLLVLNIIACSVNRWRSVWVAATGGLRVKHGDPFYTEGKNRAQLYTSEAEPSRSGITLIKALRRRGYRVRAEDTSGRLYLSATKNGFSPLATYLVHLSLILFVAAFLVTSYLGFRDPFLVIAEGTEVEVGHQTMLTLSLEDFTDEYWPDGTPRDYRSDVVLYKGGEEVKRGTIRVNHPMSYQGVRFYQSFFGPAAVMSVQAEDSEVLYQGSLALTGILESSPFQRPTASFLLGSENLVVQVIGPAVNLDDPYLAQGELGLELYDLDTAMPVAWTKLEKGTPAEWEGLKFTYLQEAMYSGFQVSRDPGNPLIWVASALFLIGIGIVFYLPRHQLWVMVEPMVKGSRISMRWAPVRGPGRKPEFEKLVSELQDIPDLRIKETAGDNDD
jgi:cytochrome c biogenesis protein